ncbi:MAG: glutamate/gamma-aminobutyrate family transporter YjeM [Streptococcaceae bacterium]|nr:glutamate/gamma-aminobutyrate family transporter YjeM [Streptococcaceae bacterium]MCL2681242.1 glutamate/gamma-aminobutyrate family transporter YjeM [Streptococcaceae bacterium]MCL2858633.1 glutamate/gamma-aminobutyrate family transporter YjeM [Streptococcaceae bacterium]
MSSTKTKGKLSLLALSLMIFTSVYGLNNIPQAFFKMGYASIPWYIIGALFFFIPFAFMVTELGSAYKDAKGGVYSWMVRSVGPTFAFVGTFMWYTAGIIWMVSTSDKILIPIANVIFGTTPDMSIYLISAFAILWMTFITFVSLKGIDSIQKLTSIGGIAVIALNIVLMLGAAIVLILKGFHPATPLTADAFINSPAPTSVVPHNLTSYIAFMVFAIFAYAGVEVVGGLVDQTDKPEKNFHKGIVISSIIIVLGYALGILFIGFFIDYKHDWFNAIANGSINFGNLPFVLMSDLGSSIGQSLHLSTSATHLLADISSRFAGLTLLLSYAGAFMTFLYSPLKQIISGTPRHLWPGKLGHLENDIPKNALKTQYLVVVFIILINLIISLFDKGSAANFFNILTNMTNVAATVPYIFIVFAYYKFKTNDSIEKPFIIFKSNLMAKLVTILVILAIGFSNLFTVIEPILQPQTASSLGGVADATTMLAGPLIFAVIAYLMMRNFRKKYPNDGFEHK